jgi:hypothetical protein
MLVVQILSFLVGAGLVVFTLTSAIRTFVLPRSAPDRITRTVFLAVRKALGLRLLHKQEYHERDAILAWFAPLGLLALLPTWYALILLGYTFMFWAVGAPSWFVALRDSGSSLLTLGFEAVNGFASTLLSFSEAVIGLVLVALLISYLPTIYSAFSRREAAVTLLEVRAGDPPFAETMLLRYHRIHGLAHLTEEWERWESWFADIQESHTSLAALVFFRSPQPEHSWVTAAGAVLDTAALSLAVIDQPLDPQAALCLRSGYLALRAIADYFAIPYPRDPQPDDPISVRKEEFDVLVDHLEKEGLPIRADRDQAWKDFSGWRVNYDLVLVTLAGLTQAPMAPWSSDRATNSFRPKVSGDNR